MKSIKSDNLDLFGNPDSSALPEKPVLIPKMISSCIASTRDLSPSTDATPHLGVASYVSSTTENLTTSVASEVARDMPESCGHEDQDDTSKEMVSDRVEIHALIDGLVECAGDRPNVSNNELAAIRPTPSAMTTLAAGIEDGNSKQPLVVKRSGGFQREDQESNAGNQKKKIKAASGNGFLIISKPFADIQINAGNKEPFKNNLTPKQIQCFIDGRPKLDAMERQSFFEPLITVRNGRLFDLVVNAPLYHLLACAGYTGNVWIRVFKRKEERYLTDILMADQSILRWMVISGMKDLDRATVSVQENWQECFSGAKNVAKGQVMIGSTYQTMVNRREIKND